MGGRAGGKRLRLLWMMTCMKIGEGDEDSKSGEEGNKMDVARGEAG